MAPPSNTLNSPQLFHDTIQSHRRSLLALGKPLDSYAALLIPAILNKLPPETMTRDHYDTKWTLDELMGSILKEIRIFEAVQHSSKKTTPLPTTNFFHMATNRGTRDRPKKDPTCVFCKGMHKPNLCTTISSPKERLAIIKNAGLCFNCLAHHKVSQCTSKFACRECHKKHHTSLCHAFTAIVEPLPQTPPAHRSTTQAPQNQTVPHTQTTPQNQFPIFIQLLRIRQFPILRQPLRIRQFLRTQQLLQLTRRYCCYLHIT